jgi:hypothetical protein
LVTLPELPADSSIVKATVSVAPPPISSPQVMMLDGLTKSGAADVGL